MMDEEPAPKRIRLNDADLEKLNKDDLIIKWKKQEAYITALENKTDLSDHNAAKLSEMEDRLHQQQNEFAQKERKDRLLVMRLATKEQELQELANQLTEMTKGQAPGSSQLRSALLDPALNLIFQRMRKELEDKTKLLQQAQDDMSAWKFTADSQMGKRLMSRCRTLIQENQELGKQVSAGRTARLETELALQKKYSEELKGSQDELNDFVIALDEEVVGMQSTICALQQQLKDAKQEMANLKSQASKPTEAVSATPPPPPAAAAAAATNISEQIQRTSEATSKIETRTDDMETDWKDRESRSAQIFTEPTRQSAEAPEATSWTTYERAGEVAAEKSPSTPTEEETFRIPEAPRTVEMGPTSPAIPEEASSSPAPQEETMKARTSASSGEQPMEEESGFGRKEQEEERTFQVPLQPEQQVNFRTTDEKLPPETVSTSADEVARTQDEKMETPAEPDEAAEETPMETEPVPESRAAQELQDSQVKEEMMVKEKEQDDQAAKSGDKEAKEGNKVDVSDSQGTADSNSPAVPVEKTNGSTRTEVETPDQGTEMGSTNHNTKNGEFSPAHPVSPPHSSDNNNQGPINSNCNVTNSPSGNNVEEDGPSQSTEDGTETNSSETIQNCETVATDATAADIIDRTNSPVKQILVKSSEGDSLIGGGESEGSEKQQNVADVPPLKENGPETVSN